MSTNLKDELDAGYFYCPYVPLTFSGGPAVGKIYCINDTWYGESVNIHEVMAKELRKAFTRITTFDPWTVKIITRYGKTV